LARTVRRPKTATPDFVLNARCIAAVAAEHKTKDIRAYDVSELTIIADSFVVCSATSEPHFRAVCNAIREEMKAVGISPLRSEGTTHGGWYVIDYGAVIVHVFREEARAFYDLDGLWGDAPEIGWDA